MSDVNDIWDDEEDNEMVREMFGRRKTRDNYEDVNQPSKWIADKDAEILRLRANNEKLRETLKPFAAFAESWDKNPLRGIDDTLYSIHGGESCGGADLKLSDLKNAKEVYENTK